MTLNDLLKPHVTDPSAVTVPDTLPLVNRTSAAVPLDTGDVLEPGESIMVRVAKDRMPGLMMHQREKLQWFSVGCMTEKDAE